MLDCYKETVGPSLGLLGLLPAEMVGIFPFLSEGKDTLPILK
jgi:hypothetical protein